VGLSTSRTREDFLAITFHDIASQRVGAKRGPVINFAKQSILAEQRLPRPLQNRVTPSGDIIAGRNRGMFTGNRGIIHDLATKTLTRRWASKARLTCVCEFGGATTRGAFARRG
jgi:hypothetical protein